MLNQKTAVSVFSGTAIVSLGLLAVWYFKKRKKSCESVESDTDVNDGDSAKAGTDVDSVENIEADSVETGTDVENVEAGTDVENVETGTDVDSVENVEAGTDVDDATSATYIEYGKNDDDTVDKDVYLIDENMFRLTNENWSKNSITYYKFDDCLIDDRDGYLSFNGVVTRGDPSVNAMIRLAAPGTLIFVRNTILQADFEVCIDARSSIDVIGGGTIDVSYQNALDFFGITSQVNSEVNDVDNRASNDDR